MSTSIFDTSLIQHGKFFSTVIQTCLRCAMKLTRELLVYQKKYQLTFKAVKMERVLPDWKTSIRTSHMSVPGGQRELDHQDMHYFQ